MSFDPFENRICRDVRNDIGHTMVAAIQQGSPELFIQTQARLEKRGLEKDCLLYISRRRQYLSDILKQVHTFNEEITAETIPVCDPLSAHGSDPLGGQPETIRPELDQFICIWLWNHGLFFEFHEWIEEHWLKARENHRKGFQALILAATCFEHLKYGRHKSAKRLAAKSADLFSRYASALPEWVDPVYFKQKLQHNAPAPFTLNRISRTNQRRFS